MSDDPSQVDTETLLISLRSDISLARAKLIEAWRFLDQAVVTAWELQGRETRKAPGRVKAGKARAAKLSPERRSEIARKAARTRWDRRP